MPSLDQTIRGMLQVAALAIPGMPPESQTEFENKTFSSTVGVPWARYSIDPASSRPFDVKAGLTRHNGLFLVDLFQPADDGTDQIDILSNAVKTAFAPATRLNSDGVALKIDFAERSKIMDQKPDWLMCAVTIGWHCFSPLN